MLSFKQKLQQDNLTIQRDNITTLQINMGNLCDLACNHCHVEAGPKGADNMNKATVDRIIELLAFNEEIQIVDLTGGAPELNPNFCYLVSCIRAMGKHVMNRCNLTVLSHPTQNKTEEFLADNNVEVVASLPCYSQKNVESQRGKNVFHKSIEALQMLNSLGYGTGKLKLNLVYNPNGNFLPPEQKQLEVDYKNRLLEDFGIIFNNLYTITNIPLKRYAHYLKREGLFDEYMQLLTNNFNQEATQNVMCRSMLSVSYDGTIYDCDFNQIIKTPAGNQNVTIWDIEEFSDVTNNIAMANHCYACTAGAGSSCGGSLV